MPLQTPSPSSRRPGGSSGSAGTGIKPVYIIILAVCLLAVTLLGSGGPDQTPLEAVRAQYSPLNQPYSVLLADAKEEGTFFNEYYQKLTVIVPGGESQDPVVREYDWLETTQENFDTLLPFIGMTVFKSANGVETNEASPPGYDYVGDERYGRWETRSDGTSFWAWYGMYSFFSHMMGGPVYRNDYNAYRASRRSAQPYYGPNKEFGTNGSRTRQQNPNFYARHNAKDLTARSSFSQKTQSKIGRNSVAVRSRSGGFGK